MADAPEVIVDAHLLLDGLQPLGIEFYNVAAILADHVIVMMVSVRMLVDVTPFSRPGDLSTSPLSTRRCNVLYTEALDALTPRSLSLK